VNVSPESGSSRSTPRSRGRTAPIYKRLPCGPHSFDARDVSLHQRARIHGAMVEAISRNGGYQHVSVKDVISLAAVSRRSFYEQFANREECFLATIDLTAGQRLESARLAHCESQGDPQERLAAALTGLAKTAVAERNATLLVLEQSETVGIAGRRHLLGAIAAGERMLATALAECAGTPFPAPVTRAIAGGVCAILSRRLQEGKAATVLASELTEWTLPIAARGAETSTRLAELLHSRMRNPAKGAAADPAKVAPPPEARQRLLDGAMRASARRQEGRLSAIEIADGAGVPVEAFFELFDDGAHCLRVAFAESGREILDVTVQAGRQADGEPQSVRLALTGLLEHLAAHPDRAHALIGAALCRVEAPERQSRELADALGATLTLGPHAPGFLRDATVGALSHTIRFHLAQERTGLLPAVADQLSYVTLAPVLGTGGALAALAAGD
jgi:TetR/AcrR family transcriptional regulator